MVTPEEEEEALPLRPVLTLTEEEMLVLTHGELGIPRQIELPTDAAGADLVRSVALRTLMARGLVVPGAGGATDGIPWEATEPLGVTLTLRALAPVVLELQRVLGVLEARHVSGTPAVSTLAVRYLHLHEDVAVIEDVTPHGMHSLLTVYADRYEDAIGDFIRPPGAVAGTGEPRTLRGEGAEPERTEPERTDPGGTVTGLLASMGDPTVLVEAAVVRAGEDRKARPEHEAVMLALGPGGTFWSADSVTYHPVDPGQAIQDLLRRATMGE